MRVSKRRPSGMSIRKCRRARNEKRWSQGNENSWKFIGRSMSQSHMVVTITFTVWLPGTPWDVVGSPWSRGFREDSSTQRITFEVQQLKSSHCWYTCFVFLCSTLFSFKCDLSLAFAALISQKSPGTANFSKILVRRHRPPVHLVSKLLGWKETKMNKPMKPVWYHDVRYFQASSNQTWPVFPPVSNYFRFILPGLDSNQGSCEWTHRSHEQDKVEDGFCRIFKCTWPRRDEGDMAESATRKWFQHWSVSSFLLS